MWKFRRAQEPGTPGQAMDRLRAKYANFRELLALNNECLELMAGIQEDLQYVPPRREVQGGPLRAIFGRIAAVVVSLERLTGAPRHSLAAAVEAQQQEIEQYLAALEESAKPRLFAWLADLSADSESEAGSKANVLGEIRNRLNMPVPDGFVLTTEAYRQYCGLPL